jgi:hypothetical protein
MAAKNTAAFLGVELITSLKSFTVQGEVSIINNIIPQCSKLRSCLQVIVEDGSIEHSSLLLYEIDKGT